MPLEEEKGFPSMLRTAPSVDGKPFSSSWAFRLPRRLEKGRKKAGMAQTEAKVNGAPVKLRQTTIKRGERKGKNFNLVCQTPSKNDFLVLSELTLSSTT